MKKSVKICFLKAKIVNIIKVDITLKFLHLFCNITQQSAHLSKLLILNIKHLK